MSYASLSKSDWYEILLAAEDEARMAGAMGPLAKCQAIVRKYDEAGMLEDGVLDFFMDSEQLAKMLAGGIVNYANREDWAPRNTYTRNAADRFLTRKPGRGSAGRQTAGRTSGGLTREQAEELLRRAYAQWPGRAAA